jgi:hypothetical protein
MRKVHIPIVLPEFVFRLRIWLLLHYRKLRYGYAFRKIPLTQGKFAIVDPEDYEELSKYKWYAAKMGRTFYAARTIRITNGKHRLIIMHRQVLKDSEGLFVDHINHNGLDNRKCNLRICTIQQNVWNMRKQRGNCASQYKGVTWRKDIGKWQARVICGGKVFSCGHFNDEKAAAAAYDKKAKELFGEFAALNLTLREFPAC